MEFFINECSIHGQHYEQASFDAALKSLLKILISLKEQKPNIQTYHSENWRMYQAIKTKPLVAGLKGANQNLRTAFLSTLMQKLNTKEWQKERIHSPEDWYSHDNEIVTNTCMAEVAERTMQSSDVLRLLINFPESKFTGSSNIQIIKNENDEINLDCVEQHAELTQWLEAKLQISRFTYNFNSTTPPTDEQTLLKDERLFLKTSSTYQGRTIYKEIKNNNLWYVDNLHFGLSSHIEVFNSTGNHIGESDLNGNINNSKCDDSKKLNI